jgi:ribonuclease J
MARGASLTVFDGHASIGGTKILFEQGDGRLLLDFGTNYKRQAEYYEEYLKPRGSRGLTDYLELGLLPKVRGLYRRDLFPPYDYPRKDAEWEGQRPTAILLTHAHLDHCGAVGFVDPTIPVVATPMTLALLRAWQETGAADLTSEITYVGARTPTDRGGGPGDSLPGRRLESDREAVRRSRPYQLLGGVPDGFARELQRSPFGGRTAFEPVDPVPAPCSFAGIRVEHHGVDHSVYGASSFLLEADGGLVAYSGDLRRHGEYGPQTEGFFRRLEQRRPELLIVEGTRLTRAGPPSVQASTTEAEVERNCRAEVQRFEDRLVVADFGPRNVERLRSFRRIALDTGRSLVLTPKDAYLLHLLHAVDPSIEADLGPGGMRILEEPSVGASRAWQSVVVDRYGDAYLNPHDVAAGPGRFILCFSFFDCNDLVDLKREQACEGGLWLYSSSEAHGEEQEFDFLRLQRWIRWAGMEQVGFRYLPSASGEPELRFDHPDDVGHHASGHATEAELLELIGLADPKAIVPVHTEQTPERYAELLRAKGVRAKVLAPKAGVPLSW